MVNDLLHFAVRTERETGSSPPAVVLVASIYSLQNACEAMCPVAYESRNTLLASALQSAAILLGKKTTV